MAIGASYLQGHAHCTGKVGVLGYCLGGKLAYLMVATRSGTDCAVSYYGVGIDLLLEEAVSIRKPLMLHIAGEDEYVPPSAQRAIHQGLDKNPLVTLHDYPGRSMRFRAGTASTLDKQAAQAADLRTLAFLRATLGAD